MKRSIWLSALLTASLIPHGGQAQDRAADPLYVLHPIFHTEQEQAELCLQFDHELSESDSVVRFAAALRLESDDKAIVVARKNISLGSDQMCLSGLEHRRRYRLVLAALSDGKGEKSSRPYSLSFKIPARQASLALVGPEQRDGMNVWRDAPILNSVNAGKIALELYHITDPAKMAEAWNNRLQTTLAPSESLYFARHNGTLAWKDQLTPDSALDRNVATQINFSSAGPGDFPPGLYLLAATPDEAGVDKDGQNKSNNLSLTAATWLLRSDLEIYALKDGNALTVLTEKTDASDVASNVRVLSLDGDQKILAETQSDANGVASLTVTEPPKTILALRENGAGAFLDPAALDQAPFTASSQLANLVVEQPYYAPGEMVSLGLNVHDVHKQPLALKGTELQLQRPDHSFYESHPVALDAAGHAKVTLIAPATGGLWHLLWQQADHQNLAVTDLRISRNPLAPVLALDVDRSGWGGSGEISLAVHSHAGGSMSVAPYLSGHIELSWRKDIHPFSAWKDYVFDDGKAIDSTPKPIVSFVTDAKGEAPLRLALPVPDRAPSMLEAQLRAVGETTHDVVGSETIHLPIKPGTFSIGVNPGPSQGSFPENSMAHFDVVALDRNGNSVPVDDVNYRIFEQGRDFEWFQSEGSWDYKPQQQKRRLGGGGLTFSANGRAVIEWPVTSGSYRLEITDADGTVLNAYDFKAGWNASVADAESPAELTLKALPATSQSGVSEKISFTLSQPGLVTVTVADDKIRQVIHARYPAGNGNLSFVPAADWGTQLRVRVDVHDASGNHDAGQIVLSQSTGTSSPLLLAKTTTAPKLSAWFEPRAFADITQKILAPQQSLDVGVKKTHGISQTNTIFVSPWALQELPSLLAAELQLRPFATCDVADWLQTIHLWRGTLAEAGLLSEADYQNLNKDTLERLLARQNDDGGFADAPGDGDSDMDSTIAALQLLAGDQDSYLRPAVDQAVRWLNRRLDTMWSADTELSSRAEAYAVLGKIGRVDNAGLHYFSDKYATQNLSALGAADMAYAFASIKDKPAAQFWSDQVKARYGAFDQLPMDVVARLLANPYVPASDASSALQSAVKAASHAKSIVALKNTLWALSYFMDRSDAWRLGYGKNEKAIRGVFVMATNEKTPTPLHNPASDHPLYVTMVTSMPYESNQDKMTRRFYDLNGQEVSGALKYGVTYVVVLEGVWDAMDAVTLYDSLQPLAIPVSCALPVSNAGHFLSWLSDKNLTPVKACEIGGSGIDMLMLRPGTDVENWRVAYLVKSNGGLPQKKRPAVLQKFSLDSNRDDKDARH